MKSKSARKPDIITKRLDSLLTGKMPMIGKREKEGRWLSRKERIGVIELSIYPITKLRVEYLKRRLENLHGFGKSRRSNDQIDALRCEYNKERRKLSQCKDDYFRFKTNAMSPHQVAKHFNTSARVIYRIWAKYIKTGNVLFCCDVNRNFSALPVSGIAATYGKYALCLERPTIDKESTAPCDMYRRDETTDDVPPLYFSMRKIDNTEKQLRAQRRARIDSMLWIKQTRQQFDSIARQWLNS